MRNKVNCYRTSGSWRTSIAVCSELSRAAALSVITSPLTVPVRTAATSLLLPGGIARIASDEALSSHYDRYSFWGHFSTKSETQGRRLKIQPRAEYEFLQQARERHASPEGKLLYNRRAGIEGTISQGVRTCDLRRTRYFGLDKTHLQHIATAAGINIDRLFGWFEQIPHAKTRTSRFAALAV